MSNVNRGPITPRLRALAVMHSDVDDTPIDGATTDPISSNWAYDHVAAADPHTGYRLESADHTHQSTGAQAGQLDHGLALTGLLDDDHTQYLKTTSLVFPFYVAAGTLDTIPLTADRKLPFFVAAGTASNIPLTT